MKTTFIIACICGCAVLKTMAADTLALTAVEKQFEARAFKAATRLDKLRKQLEELGEQKFHSKEGHQLAYLKATLDRDNVAQVELLELASIEEAE